MAIKKYKGIPYQLWNPYTTMDKYLPFLGVGPSVITRGEGHYVYNDHGESYINGNSGAWNFSIGFGREEIIEAVTKQMRELPFATCFGLSHPRAIELAAKLITITSGNFAHVYLGSNGSEIVETSLKLARQYHRQSPLVKDRGRFKIISLRGSYHGYAYGATTLSGYERHDAKFGPMLPGIIPIDPPYCFRCPYQKEGYPECGLECAKALEKTILAEEPESVAAFIFEPVMGEMGVITPPDEYYRMVGETCRQYGLLFIADEVTTGFGRTGQLFASQKWDPQPDMLLLGKAISGGYLPMAATLTTDAIFQRFLGTENYFMHGSTNSGHPVCAAASLKAIEIILRENLSDNAAKVGEYLKTRLIGLMDNHPIIGEVRGRGLMIGIDLVHDRKTRERATDEEIFNFMLSSYVNGLLHSLSECGLSLFPPLNIDEAIADEIVAIMDKVFHTGKLADLDRNARLLKEFIKAKL
jgi:adenosylmethionine-8-amino-7-oxononanoate aminotransferase